MNTQTKRGLGVALIGAVIWFLALAGTQDADGGLASALSLIGAVAVIATLGGLGYVGYSLIRSR